MNIDAGKVIAAGKKIITLAGDFKKSLNTIKTQNNTLKTKWTGQDAQSCFKKVDEQATELEKLYSALNEIGTKLQQIGNTFKTVSANNTLK